METTFEAVDWNQLIRFQDTAEFAKWRLKLEGPPDWILSFSDIGWDNDSAATYFTLSEIFEKIGSQLSSEEAVLFEKSLMTVVCGNCSKTVKDFPCIPESGYFVSLSPNRIKTVEENLNALDKKTVLALAEEAFLLEDRWSDPASLGEEIRGYFIQVEKLVKAASDRYWGVIGHVG